MSRPSKNTCHLSPAVVEAAVLAYLREQTAWVGYQQMMYRVSRKLRPTSYSSDGTRWVVFKVCRDLLKAGVIFRRKARIGRRSCWKKDDVKWPDEVRLNEAIVQSSFTHVRIPEVHQSTVVNHHHVESGFVATV
jgi:hypothetical protein